MFNNTEIPQMVRDIQTIVEADFLTVDERHTLLASIRDRLPPPQMRVPAADMVNNALKRVLRNDEPTKETRTPARIEDKTPVVEGQAEGSVETTTGTTSGSEEQAEDSSRVVGAASDNRRKGKPSNKR